MDLPLFDVAVYAVIVYLFRDFFKNLGRMDRQREPWVKDVHG